LQYKLSFAAASVQTGFAVLRFGFHAQRDNPDVKRYFVAPPVINLTLSVCVAVYNDCIVGANTSTNTSTNAITSPFIPPQQFIDRVRADNQRVIEASLAAVFAPTIQSLYTATQTDNVKFITGGATKYLLTSGLSLCAWKPKRKTANPVCTDPATKDSKYCKAHKYRCESEDREKAEAEAHKKYKRKYQQSKSRSERVNKSRSSSTSDSDDDVEVLGALNTGWKGPKIVEQSSVKNAPNPELQRLQKENKDLEARLQQMEQLLQQNQPQPQSQQPPSPNSSVDGIDKLLRNSALDSPPVENADGNSDSPMTVVEDNPQQKEKEKSR